MEVSKSYTQQMTSDEERFRSYMDRRRSEQAAELDALEADHKREVDALTSRKESALTDVDKAYRVEIGRREETRNKDLDAARRHHQEALKQEKAAHDAEFEKVREREQARVEEYRKNQDDVIAKLHLKYQETMDEMNRSQKGGRS